MISLFEQKIHDITDNLTCSQHDKKEILLELRDHLYSSYESYLKHGMEEDEAVQLVLKQFGQSDQIAMQFQQSVDPLHKILKAVMLLVFTLYSIGLLYELIFKRLILRTIYYFQADNTYSHYFVKSALAGTSPKQYFNFSQWQMDINVFPLETIMFYLTTDRVNTNIVIENLLAGIILFFPLGFFLSLLFTKIKRFSAILITAFVVGFLIEGLQFALQVGIADIDDIILYVIGASIGYFVAMLLLKLNITKIKRRFKSQ